LNISTALNNLPEWAALGASGGMGFFFVRWAFEWFGGRMDKRQELVDAGTKALIEHLQDQITSLIEQQGALHDRVDRLQKELDACHEKHSESEAKVKQLEATMLGMGDARQRAQLIVSEEKANQ